METIENISKAINRDYLLLAPCVQERAKKAVRKCWDGGIRIEIFEGWRSAGRQNELYAQGRTSEGPIVTQSRAWQSFHQVGLAFDLAFLKADIGWSWEGPWDKVTPIFESFGFQSLQPQEKSHFQLTGGLRIAEAVQYYTQYSMQGLWLYVAEKLK